MNRYEDEWRRVISQNPHVARKFSGNLTNSPSGAKRRQEETGQAETSIQAFKTETESQATTEIDITEPRKNLQQRFSEWYTPIKVPRENVLDIVKDGICVIIMFLLFWIGLIFFIFAVVSYTQIAIIVLAVTQFLIWGPLGKILVTPIKTTQKENPRQKVAERLIGYFCKLEKEPRLSYHHYPELNELLKTTIIKENDEGEYAFSEEEAEFVRSEFWWLRELLQDKMVQEISSLAEKS